MSALELASRATHSSDTAIAKDIPSLNSAVASQTKSKAEDFSLPSHGDGPEPKGFGVKALRSLALSLGITGSLISVLVLDHNHLGDEGLEILTSGLARSPSLRSVSLAYCGFGPNGALAFTSTMIPLRETPGLIKETPTPKYEIVNLQGNKLGGQGLIHLSKGVGSCTSLKSLNIAAIGVDGQDILAVKEFVASLALNKTIADVDFSANNIGTRGSELFIPLLNVTKHIKILRITPRLGRDVAKHIRDAIQQGGKKKAKHLPN